MLIYELTQKAHDLTNRVNDVLRQFDLHNAQFQILLCLDAFGPLKLSQLKAHLKVKAPTITRTVQRLIDTGRVEHVPAVDQREKVIQLTDEAAMTNPNIRHAVNGVEEDVIHTLTEEEMKQLRVLLEKIASE